VTFYTEGFSSFVASATALIATSLATVFRPREAVSYHDSLVTVKRCTPYPSSFQLPDAFLPSPFL